MSKTCNQEKTIEKLIMDILADEAQIIHCLKEFFCKTLHELSECHYLTLERKVNSAKDLICAAAQKEAALADVLEAISKIIEEEPDEWIMLPPGTAYQVTSQNPTISSVTFDAKTDAGVTGGIIAAFVAGNAVGEVISIDDTPENYSISLGGPIPPNQVLLINTNIVTVYIRDVVAT